MLYEYIIIYGVIKSHTGIKEFLFDIFFFERMAEIYKVIAIIIYSTTIILFYHAKKLEWQRNKRGMFFLANIISELAVCTYVIHYGIIINCTE